MRASWHAEARFHQLRIDDHDIKGRGIGCDPGFPAGRSHIISREHAYDRFANAQLGIRHQLLQRVLEARANIARACLLDKHQGLSTALQIVFHHLRDALFLGQPGLCRFSLFRFIFREDRLHIAQDFHR